MSKLFPLLAAAVLSMGAVLPASADDPRVSGPFTHDNLTIYLVHGESLPGPVPLTLAEALLKGAVTVHETGNVNELSIENLGSEEIFVQSGDIVKGGQQDRVVMSSLVLRPGSGRVPLDAFCVEQGRWAARGDENVMAFSSAFAALPSKEAKLAMKAPPRAAELAAGDTGERQRKIWETVAGLQAALSAGVGATVVSQDSASSLQLALENDRLAEERARSVKALHDVALVDDDVVGFVFAVNGELNSADLYPSNGLFRKMWEKGLAAAATEAIGKRGATPAAATAPAPELQKVSHFIATAGHGKAEEKRLSDDILIETRDADAVYQFETRRKDGRFIHRNILAK